MHGYVLVRSTVYTYKAKHYSLTHSSTIILTIMITIRGKFLTEHPSHSLSRWLWLVGWLANYSLIQLEPLAPPPYMLEGKDGGFEFGQT